MEIKNKDLKRRILEISHKYHLSHLGSCLTAVDIINEIYETMNPLMYKTGWDERFVNDSGHSGLAQYVVLEKFGWGDAEEMFLKHGVHPNRDVAQGIYTSTGSLGMGISLATGMAIAKPKKRVFVLASDGGVNEGVFYECLEVAYEQKLTNLKLYINCNGWGAMKPLNRDHIIKRFQAFDNIDITFRQTNVDDFPFLKGLQSHYHVMTDQEYEQAMEILK